MMRPCTSPRAHDLAARSRRTPRRTRSCARRSSTPPRSRSSSSAIVLVVERLAARDRGRPLHRLLRTPGAPPSAAHDEARIVGRPSAGPAARRKYRALASAFSSNVSNASSASSSARLRDAGRVERRSRRCRARRTVGTQLAQLARAARGEQQHGSRVTAPSGTSRARAAARRRARACPFTASSSSAIQLGAVERAVLAGALHLDEPSLAAHHDVHVDLGAHVLLVVEVEPRRRRR